MAKITKINPARAEIVTTVKCLYAHGASKEQLVNLLRGHKELVERVYTEMLRRSAFDCEIIRETANE